jgi:GNAT superfamily N-acetyltransferase
MRGTFLSVCGRALPSRGTRHDSLAFFSAEEIAVAEELVAEAVAKGADSDYLFLFAEAADGDLRGYSCFGRIPATQSSFDLYWIAVAPEEQGRGLGREIIGRSEKIAADLGGTRMFVDTAGREQYAPTRAFYERMGYEVAAWIDDFYAPGDAKVVYAKALGAAA